MNFSKIRKELIKKWEKAEMNGKFSYFNMGVDLEKAMKEAYKAGLKEASIIADRHICKGKSLNEWGIKASNEI